ncbi:MAG: hypothetical protein K6F80_02870 [Oscillospiraceae bacterium]|nr:hypothetical protein [Oscillospiraceae bacterium]
MRHWEAVTTKPFKIREFRGDHFYLFDHSNAVADTVVEDMLHCCTGFRQHMQDLSAWEVGTI